MRATEQFGVLPEQNSIYSGASFPQAREGPYIFLTRAARLLRFLLFADRPRLPSSGGICIIPPWINKRPPLICCSPQSDLFHY